MYSCCCCRKSNSKHDTKSILKANKDFPSTWQEVNLQYLKTTAEGTLFILLKEIYVVKAKGIERISGKLL